MPIKNIVGQKFGRLEVTAFHDTQKGYARWKCVCECGEKTIALGTHLRQGNTNSCGCLHADNVAKKHGWHGTRTYESWQNMIRRCVDKKHKRYARYGGRGITVCKEWRDSFEAFLKDMGERPEDSTLERKHPNKGYDKDNCEWLLKSKNTIDSYRGRPTKRAISKLESN